MTRANAHRDYREGAGPQASPLDLAARVAALEAVIFDLDGTLVDTIDLILTSFRHASSEVLGEVLPDEVFLREVGIPLATQMRSFSEEHAEELLVAYRAHNAAHHDELIREYEGTGPALDELRRRGMRLAVVTSKLNSVAQRGLDCFGLGPHFDFVIGADDVTVHKPNPHPLLEAAARMGLEPAVCAYVGDAPYDMMAARAAGMLSIAATWGAHDHGRLLEPGPDFEIAHIGELPKLLFGEESRFRVAKSG